MKTHIDSVKININNSNNVSLSSSKPLMVEKVNIEKTFFGSNTNICLLNSN